MTDIITPSFLQKHFAVSNEAAEKRIDTLSRQFDYRATREAKENGDLIVLKFGPFINSLKPSGYYTYSSYEDEEEMQKERDTWHSKRYR